MRWNKRTGDVDQNGQPKGKQKCQLATIQICELSDNGCRKYDAFDKRELVIGFFKNAGVGIGNGAVAGFYGIIPPFAE